MPSRNIMIIGASRGIGLGLGLAREFLVRGWQVYASERSRSPALHETSRKAEGRLHIVSADVTDRDSIAALTAAMRPHLLDVVLVNAGIYDARSVDMASDADIQRIMITNAAGPVRAGRALLPLIREGGTLAFTTSLMGSIADSTGGADLYRMSKAAQNILARGLFEEEAKSRRVAVLSLHPGWVQTDMGGNNAPLSVEQSVQGLADILEAEQPLAHRFLDYAGQELPW